MKSKHIMMPKDFSSKRRYDAEKGCRRLERYGWKWCGIRFPEDYDSTRVALSHIAWWSIYGDDEYYEMYQKLERDLAMHEYERRKDEL